MKNEEAGGPEREAGVSCSLLLRTHTSSVQIRVMEKQQPPVRIIVPGRVYRRDNADATHNPTFHQVEGLYVDRNVTVGDLKGTVEFVFKELMGEETRIRFRPTTSVTRSPASRSTSAARTSGAPATRTSRRTSRRSKRRTASGSRSSMVLPWATRRSMRSHR